MLGSTEIVILCRTYIFLTRCSYWVRHPALTVSQGRHIIILRKVWESLFEWSKYTMLDCTFNEANFTLSFFFIVLEAQGSDLFCNALLNEFILWSGKHNQYQRRESLITLVQVLLDLCEGIYRQLSHLLWCYHRWDWRRIDSITSE